MPKKKSTRKKRRSAPVKGVALYHDMKVYEDFERCATRLFEILRDAAQRWPGRPRRFYLDVQGHRNSEGGFDHDAWELMSEFIPKMMFPYLTEVSTPLLRARNGEPQREDLPDRVEIYPPLDGSSGDYDAQVLNTRNRPEINGSRVSVPTVEQIADYLGLTDAHCLVCWAKPVERAHALPRSLAGSNSLANLALLCGDHHREAPDVADAEAFWKWIDYAELRDSNRRMARIAETADIPMPTTEPKAAKTTFFTEVMTQLKELYDWQDDDFHGPAWSAILTEYYEILHHNTGKHFGVEAKVSTHAWAFDIARRRVSRNSRVRDQAPVDAALELIQACHRDNTLAQRLAEHCLDRLVPAMSDPRDVRRVEAIVAELGDDLPFRLPILEMTVAALRPVEG